MSGLVTESLSSAGSRRQGRCPFAGQIEQFDVPLPAGLSAYGTSVRASAIGNPDAEPVVLLGGISANCFPAVQPCGSLGWWPGLVGDDQAIDPERHYIIGVDFAADESGNAAPSTFDQAKVLAAALDVIGVAKPCTIIGASYGGMVALALAQLEPDRIKQLVVISAGAEPHAAATAARELQRRVVALGLANGQGEDALAIARGMAMLTYRTSAEFGQRFTGGIDDEQPCATSKPGEYLKARGKTFLSVMSPGRYLSLSASIDRHRIDPSKVDVPTLLIGASSDQLVPSEQLHELAGSLAGPVELHLLDSLFGHDMFLKESARIADLVTPLVDDGR